MTENFEFRMVPLDQLHESQWNTRKHFDDKKFEELLGSVVRVGVLTPLLARPRSFNGPGHVDDYEIAAGHRRYKAAKKAGLKELPVRIRHMTDAEFLEIVTIENLQREDLHPLDEALGYQALVKKAGYDVPAIAAKVGKSESYVYQRLKLAELIEPAKKLFFENEITAGHAVLIARLQPKDQREVVEKALFERFGDRDLIGVRGLADWIQRNVHLDLHSVPFNKTDPDLVPAAGACTTCPKRTRFLPQLFPDIAKKDTCTDRACFSLKLHEHISRKKAQLEAEGQKLAEISTEYGWSGNDEKKKGRPLNLNEYSLIPGKKDLCEDAQKAIVVQGQKDLGRVVDICRNPKCKVHHGGGRSDDTQEMARYRADQKRRDEKERNEKQLRQRILDAVLKKAPATLSLDDLRLVASAHWSRLWHDFRKLISARRGWEPGKKQYGGPDFEGYGQKQIAGADAVWLTGFLLEISLVSDRMDDTGRKTVLLETARRYKVDVAGIEKQFASEVAEKKAKKVAREKRAKDQSKVKLKKRANGAEPETPAPSHVHAGPKPKKGEHACEVCRCTESHACENGCWWDHEYLKKKRYVCNNCIDQAVLNWPEPPRRKSVQPSAKEATPA